MTAVTPPLSQPDLMAQLVAIEPATRDDLAAIAAFQIAMAMESEGCHLDFDTVRKGVAHVLLKNPGSEPGFRLASEIPFYLIARHAQQGPVGCLLVQSEWSDWRNGVVWWIHSVYLMPEARALGLFRAMYDTVEKLAQEQNIRGLRLYVDKRNTHAQRVYLSVGMSAEHYDMYERMF